MNIIFKEIPNGFARAKVVEVNEKQGKYGLYLQLIFAVIEKGELENYRFSAIIKPTPLKTSKFYRWITNILTLPPDDHFYTQDLIGKECSIYIAKQNNFYSVVDVSMTNSKITLGEL